MGNERKQIQSVLNILFYLLAAATLVIFYYTPDKNADRMWMYCGFVAVGVRVITYIMRVIK